MNDVLDWLLEQPPQERTPVQLVEELAEKLCAAGVPLWRLSTTLLSFDPNLAGSQYRWVEGARVQVFQRAIGQFNLPDYRGSPVEAAIERGEDHRCRLDVPEPALAFPRTLTDLARGGGTDYLILTLPMGEALSSARFHISQSRGWISFATRAAGGFTDEQVQGLKRLRNALALRLALETSKASARRLLEAYLGRNAARRVLEGSFKRGTAAPIQAVIWYCDMRGFTQLSDHTAAAQVVRTLDGYFEAAAQPIEDHGGEVLKFIGDAVLAIFPLDEGGASTAAQAALRAVAKARENLTALNEQMRGSGESPLGFGIALHVGEVMYGNIGTRSRLDFTVIGAPVNEVCRVEPLTRTLGVDVLLTREFVQAAELAEDQVRSLGHHALRGVSTEREVFRLADEATTPARAAPADTSEDA